MAPRGVALLLLLGAASAAPACPAADEASLLQTPASRKANLVGDEVSEGRVHRRRRCQPTPSPSSTPAPTPAPETKEDAPTSAWSLRTTLNCYEGHGGVPSQPSDQPYTDISVEECKDKCRSDALCQGIVIDVNADTGSNTSRCWLRQRITLADCETSPDFATWVFSPWQSYPGYTCYAGNGAVEMATNESLLLKDCKLLCRATPACQGVVLEKNGSDFYDTGSCFLRTEVDLTACDASSADYDFYMLDAYKFIPGKNCYPGHGASRVGSDPIVESDLLTCQEVCNLNPWCEGVVRQTGSGKCFLHGSVEVSECQDEDGYDLWLRGPAALPGRYDWIREIAEQGGKHYLEAKTYYIDRQYQLPEGTEIIGAGSSPGGTVIQADHGIQGEVRICEENFENRVGFLLGNHTSIRGLRYVGKDENRAVDNLQLCGGAPFETPGCTYTRCGCKSDPSCTDDGPVTGNGVGVRNATVEDVVVEALTVQNVVMVPPTKFGVDVSRDILIKNVRTLGTWADGVNIHGRHDGITVQGCDMKFTGDDVYAAWSSDDGLTNVRFLDNVAAKPVSNAPTRFPTACFAIFGGNKYVVQGNSCNDNSRYGNLKIDNFPPSFWADDAIVTFEDNEESPASTPPCIYAADWPAGEPPAVVGCEPVRWEPVVASA